MSDFDSAWWKWRWAVGHTKALTEEVTRWIAHRGGNPLIKTDHEYDPKRHGFVVRISKIEALPITLGLKLGDSISNYRMSLDHAAWAMVQRGSTPNLSDDAARKVYFPFARSLGHWEYLVPIRLPGVTHTDRAVVRRYQPYRNQIFRKSLGLLSSLANDDKHRTIQPVLALPTTATVNVSNPRDCENPRISRRSKGRVGGLKVDTELGCVYVKKTGPNPQIDMQTGTVETQLGITPEFRLDNWLSVTCVVIADFLCELSGPPFLWDERVPPWAWPPPGRHPGSPSAAPTHDA